jgi:hypothetical protein
MIMKLKKQRPGPKRAVEPVKKKTTLTGAAVSPNK